MRFRDSLFGTTLVRDRFDSRVYICRIFFVLFVPGYSAITICFSWTFICRDLQLALMVEKLIVKNLSTLDGL